MSERCDSPCGELTRLEQRIDSYEVQSNSARQQLDDRLRVLENSGAVLKERYSTILSKIDCLTKSTEEKIDKLTNKVDAMESKPGKRWESVVMCAITTVCTAVLVFLLSKIGL